MLVAVHVQHSYCASCTVVEKNFYVPWYFSSFINTHDSYLVMDPKKLNKVNTNLVS
jgi:hypothetical protein